MLRIVGTIVLILLLSLILVTREAVKITDFGPNEIFQLLTVIAFVATLQHSAVEVFISTWRDPEEEDMNAELERYDERLKAPKLSEENRVKINEARKDVELRKKKYKAGTRKVALWASLFLGVFISVVGVRALESLVSPAEIAKLSEYQALGFRLMDVLLTGSLISGGTEGVHQVTNIFGNFLNSTAEKAKGSPPPANQAPATPAGQ